MDARRLQVAVLTAMSVFAGSCARQANYVEQSLQANLVMEEVNNKVLLLNVVRAYKRRPMHFSTFEKIGAPAGFGATTQSIVVPFGPDGVGAYPLTFGFGLDRPNFSVFPLDKQEFARGFTTPVPLQLIGYYFDQGWPRDMLLHVFFRQIDVLKSDGSVLKSVVNYPQDPTAMKNFQELTSKLAACEIESTTTTSEDKIGPPLKDADVHDLQKLAAAAAQQLTLEPLPSTGYQLKRVKRSVALALLNDPVVPDADCANALKVLRTDRPAAAPLIATSSAETSEARPALALHVRSPEAIVYYLGEIARAGLDGRYDSNGELDSKDKAYVQINSRPGNTTRARSRVLFKLSEGQADRSAIAVEHEGQTFSVPTNDTGGRSMHVLSLVSQLIGLQKNATDLPATSTIRLSQ